MKSQPSTKRYAKSALLVATGLLWLLFAVGLVMLLVQHLRGGAGVGCFSVSAFTVWVGLAPLTGLTLAAGLCFVIGAGFCAVGLVPVPELEPKPEAPAKQCLAALHHFSTVSSSREGPDTAWRCVRCEVGLSAPVQICPECGWTQPADRDACLADS